MIRYIMVLFLGITMTYASVDARRSGERTSSSKVSKAKKMTSRRGKGGSRRVTNARTAKITVASEVVDGIDLTTETEGVETIGTTDVLQEKVDTVKKEINAIEQCVVTLCDAGTDEESTKMALCSDNYKKKKLEKREEELREKEDKVRITLADLPKVKLSTAERKIYDSIEAPEKEENDLGDDDMNFDDLMGSIADMSDALDGEGAKRRITGSVLLTKAVDLCAKKFPNIIDDKQNFIDLMTVRADNSANALGEHYDKKAYKLDVALNTAMKKLRMASVDKHRDNLDTDSCVKKIISKAQGIYGTDFEELAKCDDLTSDCSAKNFAQFEDSKKAFATTLDSCKDGAGAWEIALLKVKRTLEQSAKTEIFDSKSKSVEQLAEVQDSCKETMLECIKNVCGGDETGNIFCYSGNDPFKDGSDSGLSLYKKKDTAKVTSVFSKMGEKYGVELKQISKSDAKKSCVIEIESCDKKIALLSENPALSKMMLDTNLNSEDLFKRVFVEVQILADRDFAKHEGKIVSTQLSAIKNRLSKYAELNKNELDNELVMQQNQTDSAINKQDDANKLHKETLRLAREKDKTKIEDKALRAENIQTLTNRKLTAETTLLKNKSDTKAKKKRIKKKGKVDEFQAERDTFYKLFCDAQVGKYDSSRRTCSFDIQSVRNKKHSWDSNVSVSSTNSLNFLCKKGSMGITKKVKGCTFPNGTTIKGDKGKGKGGACKIPSLELMYETAKNGEMITDTCFGDLDLGSALQKTIANTTDEATR